MGARDEHVDRPKDREQVAQLRRLASLTIADVSGTALTREVAPALVRQLADERLELSRLGDQILVLEEIEGSVSGWMPGARPSARVLAWMRTRMKSSTGSEKRLHMARPEKDDEAERFFYVEGRSGLLQTESWVSIDGAPQRHRVKGPPLEPAVWLHDFHEPSDAEWRQLGAAAKDAGPDAL
ncbi:MAG: hypothetical protein AAF690_23605 [Acidobacteriota bacterium]